VKTPAKPREPARIACAAIDPPPHRLKVAGHILQRHEASGVAAQFELVVTQKPPVWRRAFVEPQLQVTGKPAKDGIEPLAERRLARVRGIEVIGHQDQRVQAGVGHRHQFLALRVPSIADMARADDPDPSVGELDRAPRQFDAFGQRQPLHLARLAHCKQGVRTLGDIPVDETGEAIPVDPVVFRERCQHHRYDTVRALAHFPFFPMDL
jgi:hypothetical protein